MTSDDIVRRADRWLASSVSGPAPAGLVMDLRAEIERLRAERDDLFRTLSAVLLTTGNVKVAESTIVALQRPTISRIEQPPYVIYGATR